MIEATEPVFPNNAVELIADQIPSSIDADITVIKRPLRPTDPNQSVGIFGSLWLPDDDSYEMGSVSPLEPTISKYQLTLQCFVKDGDEVRGLAVHSILSKRVRDMLYRDAPLRVGLGVLYVTEGDSTERLKRWGIRNHQYMNNSIEGQFVYLSTLDFWIETETT